MKKIFIFSVVVFALAFFYSRSEDRGVILSIGEKIVNAVTGNSSKQDNKELLNSKEYFKFNLLKLTGDVSLIRDGESLSVGDFATLTNVYAGDIFKTGKDSLLMFSFGGEEKNRVSLGAESSVKIEAIKKEMPSRLRLLKGTIYNHLKNLKGNPFEIIHKSYNIGVRGTTFLVSTYFKEEKDGFFVYVYSGNVYFKRVGQEPVPIIESLLIIKNLISSLYSKDALSGYAKELQKTLTKGELKSKGFKPVPSGTGGIESSVLQNDETYDERIAREKKQKKFFFDFVLNDMKPIVEAEMKPDIPRTKVVYTENKVAYYGGRFFQRNLPTLVTNTFLFGIIKDEPSKLMFGQGTLYSFSLQPDGKPWPKGANNYPPDDYSWKIANYKVKKNGDLYTLQFDDGSCGKENPFLDGQGIRENISLEMVISDDSILIEWKEGLFMIFDRIRDFGKIAEGMGNPETCKKLIEEEKRDRR